MSVDDLVTLLVEDVEEELDSMEEAPLYGFTWFLRGQDDTLKTEQMAQIAARAFHVVVERHDLRLVWMRWPQQYLREAGPGTSPHLGYSPEPPDPYLVLVPASRQFGPAPADRNGSDS